VILVGAVEQSLPPFVERDRVVVRLLVVRVQEIIKGSSKSAGENRTVKVKQYGGTLSVAGREFVTNYPVEPLKPGDEVILFLTLATDGATFEVANGPLGTYRIADKANGIVAVGQSQARMSEFAGRRQISKADLVGQLRALTHPR
jgi:hypothetical protein